MITRRQCIQVVAAAPLYAKKRITVQPITPYNIYAPIVMAKTMESVFGFGVQIADPISIPDELKVSIRGRYFAADLIDTLPKKLTMGVTSVDICQETKHPIYGKVADWGIIGAAELSGIGGIVSTHRISPKWLPKITVHEMGHLLGYNHCETPTCSMFNIRGQGSKYEAINLGEFCDRH